MFEDLREALRGFGRSAGPTDRRAALASMKEALVHARLGLQDLRAAVATTEQRLAAERRELETVVRRRGLAEQVGDAETVAVADRFVAQHAERVRVLEQKRAAQLDELSLGEREYDEMSRELKRVMAGLPLGGSSPEAAAMREVEEALGERPADPGAAELDAMARARSRAEREASVAERLAELKRQLGKES
jgi:hypothetical protein